MQKETRIKSGVWPENKGKGPGKDTMHNQTVRLFLYSSTAILALTLVWAFKLVPKQAELADKSQVSSLEQELIMLSSAVKSGTQALKYRLLDVLKAEGNDRPTRTFQDSPFITAGLIEWNENTWKVLWNSSKTKGDLSDVRAWLKDWPLAKIAADEVFFAKVGDQQGQAYFAVLVPVRKPNNIPMFGIGVFPASAFGLNFSADRTRDVRVFDNQGFALALRHPAYIGASLKNEPLIAEVLSGEEVSVRKDWTSDRGLSKIGAAIRLPDSNLYAAVETTKTPAPSLGLWMYFFMSAAGAILMNWALFANLIQPLLRQLAQTEELSENLKRQLVERRQAEPTMPRSLIIEDETLPEVDFTEPKVEEPTTRPSVTLAKVVGAALRSLDGRIRETGINVKTSGLEAIPAEFDVLQMQTGIEEVLKNSIEAMQEGVNRNLYITADVRDSRVHLNIEDTGIGVAADNVKKVFDPFFSTKDSQGTARGLGLNVVRRVFEEIGGKVTFKSTEGKGTTVDIEWPAPEALMTETTSPTVENSTEASSTPALAEAPTMSMKDMIFLGEDEDDSEVEEFQTVKPNAHRPSLANVAVRKPLVRTLD